MLNSLRSTLIILGIIVAVFTALNPGKESHLEKIKDKFCTDNPITCVIVGDRADRIVVYENRFLFSRTVINGEIASIGMLGFVVARDLQINLF